MFYVALIIIIICSFSWIYSIICFLSNNQGKIHIVFLKKFDKYIIKSKKGLYYIVMVTILFALNSIQILINRINIIIVLFTLFFMIITGIAYINDLLSNSTKYIWITGIVFIYGYILIFGIGVVGIIANNATNTIFLAIGVVLLIIIIFSSLWIAIKNLKNKIYKLLVVASCYILILVLGSWIFGFYYLYNECWSSEVIKSFECVESPFRILWMLSKNSLGGFYNYPSQSVIRFVAVLQYFIGKVLDLILLGYIFNVIFELSNKDNNGKSA